jgi:hypothetical protein
MYRVSTNETFGTMLFYRVFEVKKHGTMFFSTECFANGTLDMSGTTANLSSRSNLYRVFFLFY